MEYALADTGVWYGIFDARDQRYNEAKSKIEFFDFFRIVIPWPTVYETLRTRFVRNRFALQQFEKFLKTHHGIVYLDDDIYRNDAFDLSIESSLRRGRPLSMVDCLLRLIIGDQNAKINYLLTFNQPDFIDLCKKNHVEIL
jgi:predicted nucleic acid-binding protein